MSDLKRPCKIEDVRLERRGWQRYTVNKLGETVVEDNFAPDDSQDVYVCLNCESEWEDGGFDWPLVFKHLGTTK